MMRKYPFQPTFTMLFAFACLGLLGGCAASRTGQAVSAAPSGQVVEEVVQGNSPSSAVTGHGSPASDLGQRPVTWEAAYKVKDVALAETAGGKPKLKIGADIEARNGSVVLREVIKGLVELKGMNVSWTSDVDQQALVDVDIKADDDFWTALDNILRQLDYFYEFENNTIVVRYKETRRFYLPMPFLTGSYKTVVGGDLLGSEETSEGLMKGTLSVEHNAEKIDIWETIQQNLDHILNLAVTQVSAQDQIITAEDEDRIKQQCKDQFPSRPAQQALCSESARTAAKAATQKPPAAAETEKKGAKDTETRGSREGFFYTVDKPLGIVTVTAPRSLLEQVDNYLDALKNELYRQVVIEAKIIEVTLDKDYQRGVDWSDLLKNSGFDAQIIFGGAGGQIYPKEGIKLISQVNLLGKDFQVFVNALGEYGDVKVLSNPKLSLMNGQPAMLTVGESVRYIDSVSSTIDSETGIITYTVDTKSILSGLGLGVVGSISAGDEVILHLTPVTSKLQEPIEYRGFGSTGSEATVGLPRVFLREMTTMARVKSGQLLVIGGLIDDTKGKEENKVPLLGDVPLLGMAFKNTRDYSHKRELIILLRPQVVSL